MLQDEAGRLKVTDFGLSKIYQEKDLGYKMTGRTGSCKRCLTKTSIIKMLLVVALIFLHEIIC